MNARAVRVIRSLWALLLPPCIVTSQARAEEPGEQSPALRIGPGLGPGFSISYVPGPGGELFVAADWALWSPLLLRGEVAGILWRHVFPEETVFDTDRELGLDTELTVTQLRVQARALVGLELTEIVAIYAGAVAGYAATNNADALCGERDLQNAVYGVALQPVLYLDGDRALELSLNTDLGVTPNAYCTQISRTGVVFFEDTNALGTWTALRVRYRF